MKIYKDYVKRIIDFLLALTALLVLSPVFIFVAIFIKLTSKGPVFYCQKRMGKDAKLFTVFKFRTMTDRKNRIPGEEGAMLFEKHNDEIIFGGLFLRRTKIDELPQLLNILIGDMSLVGPRPCLPTPLENFDKNGIQRFKTKPGCTGLSQINGNIYIPWPQRWEYDAIYVNNISFYNDLKIIIKTFCIILLGEKRFVKNK